MIKAIGLKNCATYSNDGALIENCQKINSFYGPNGSGKSTIGNFLRAPADLLYRDCYIKWENDSKAEVLVYNREFRENNINENIAGVFTLGQAAIEDIKNLEEMKKSREQKNNDYTRRKETLEAKKKEENILKEKFRDDVWEKIFKPNDAEFQEAFIGSRNNKERFRDEVLMHFQKSHLSSKNRNDLLVRAKTLFTQKPEKCTKISWNLDNTVSQIVEIETSSIWNKIVVGNKDIPFGRFIETLNNADWVNQGRMYIKDGNTCPFCQQLIDTQELKKQLDAFFCGEYEQDVKFITNSIDQYKSMTEELLRYVSSLQSNLEAFSAAEIDKEKMEALLQLLRECIAKNQIKMHIKEKEPGRIVSLGTTSIMIRSLQELIVTGNEFIAKHNAMVDNFTSEKDNLICDIWSFLMDEHKIMISEYLNAIDCFAKAKKGIGAEIDTCRQQLEDLDIKIVEAGKNITSVQPTVDEINRLLKSYGFTNFKIVPSPQQNNAYQIQRLDGTLASNTLSEGEETFISFLYFLQLAKGSVNVEKISNRKILVLDDPICSLDSTVLYIVSSLIRELTKNVRDGVSDVEQMFILTHNVFFHKEASFIDGRTEICKDVNFWIISKDNNTSTIRSYGQSNPIKTSYELLWHELKNNSNASLVTTQNIMRRILENYFSILGKKIDESIVDSFQTVEEKVICHSLLSWINDGSHSIPDDLYIDSYTDSIERYKQVFKEIFYKMNHDAHYEMMMK